MKLSLVHLNYKSKVAYAFVESPLQSESYVKPLFNLPPSVFNYPKYFEGSWKANLTYKDALFTSDISRKELLQDVNIAGFRRYSVAFIPDIGSSANNILFQFISTSKSNSSVIIEDRQTNVISLFNSFTTQFNTSLDKFEYNAKDNPNRLSIQFHTPTITGRAELFTNYRSLTYLDNGIKTIEHFRQSTVRRKEGQQASQIICDFAMEWTFIPVSFSSDNTNVTEMYGTCNLLAYLQPQDDLYFVRSNRPVVLFEYATKFQKII
jgi:hypothetical protein